MTTKEEWVKRIRIKNDCEQAIKEKKWDQVSQYLPVLSPEDWVQKKINNTSLIEILMKEVHAGEDTKIDWSIVPQSFSLWTEVKQCLVKLMPIKSPDRCKQLLELVAHAMPSPRTLREVNECLQIYPAEKNVDIKKFDEVILKRVTQEFKLELSWITLDEWVTWLNKFPEVKNSLYDRMLESKELCLFDFEPRDHQEWYKEHIKKINSQDKFALLMVLFASDFSASIYNREILFKKIDSSVSLQKLFNEEDNDDFDPSRLRLSGVTDWLAPQLIEGLSQEKEFLKDEQLEWLNEELPSNYKGYWDLPANMEDLTATEPKHLLTQGLKILKREPSQAVDLGFKLIMQLSDMRASGLTLKRFWDQLSNEHDIETVFEVRHRYIKEQERDVFSDSMMSFSNTIAKTPQSVLAWLNSKKELGGNWNDTVHSVTTQVLLNLFSKKEGIPRKEWIDVLKVLKEKAGVKNVFFKELFNWDRSFVQEGLLEEWLNLLGEDSTIWIHRKIIDDFNKDSASLWNVLPKEIKTDFLSHFKQSIKRVSDEDALRFYMFLDENPDQDLDPFLVKQWIIALKVENTWSNIQCMNMNQIKNPSLFAKETLEWLELEGDRLDPNLKKEWLAKISIIGLKGLAWGAVNDEFNDWKNNWAFQDVQWDGVHAKEAIAAMFDQKSLRYPDGLMNVLNEIMPVLKKWGLSKPECLKEAGGAFHALFSMGNLNEASGFCHLGLVKTLISAGLNPSYESSLYNYKTAVDLASVLSKKDQPTAVFKELIKSSDFDPGKGELISLILRKKTALSSKMNELLLEQGLTHIKPSGLYPLFYQDNKFYTDNTIIYERLSELEKKLLQKGLQAHQEEFRRSDWLTMFNQSTNRSSLDLAHKKLINFMKENGFELSTVDQNWLNKELKRILTSDYINIKLLEDWLSLQESHPLNENHFPDDGQEWIRHWWDNHPEGVRIDELCLEVLKNKIINPLNGKTTITSTNSNQIDLMTWAFNYSIKKNDFSKISDTFEKIFNGIKENNIKLINRNISESKLAEMECELLKAAHQKMQKDQGPSTEIKIKRL